MKAIVVRSLKWTFFQQFATQIVNYLSIIFLATMIDPNIHGFMTIVSIPIGFIGVLGSFGVREKILKEKNLTVEYVRSLFGFVLISSLLVYIVTLFLVFAIGYFYKANFDYNELIKYGILISIISPIGILNHFFESFQTRELNFKALSIINILSIIGGVGVSMVLAYFKFDYLALSMKFILPNLFFLLFYLFYFRPSLKFSWNPEIYKTNKSFSGYLTLNNIANYFVRNVDYLIIGKMFSADVLGQYSIAYKILLFPMRNITSKIQYVMIPIVSKLNPQSNEFKTKYFLIVGFLAFIIFPIMGIMGVTSNVWVGLVFNGKYNLLVEMVMILAVVGAFQSLVSPVGTLFLLKEKTKLMFYNSLIVTIIVILIYFLSALTLNIFVVLLSFAITWILIIMPITIFKIFKIYEFSIFDFLKNIVAPLISSVLSILAYIGVQRLISFENHVLQFGFSIVIFFIVYSISYSLINRNDSNSLSSYLKIIKSK